MAHNPSHFSSQCLSPNTQEQLMLQELEQVGLHLHMLPHHREKIKKTKTNAASGQAHA